MLQAESQLIIRLDHKAWVPGRMMKAASQSGKGSVSVRQKGAVKEELTENSWNDEESG